MPLTTISDSIHLALGGSPALARLQISWPSMTVGNLYYPAGEKTIGIGPTGSFAVALPPNDAATPSGTYYSIIYFLRGGSELMDEWIIPTSSTPLTISQVRVNRSLPPSPFAVPVGQISTVGFSVGDVLAYNGQALSIVQFQQIYSAPFTVSAPNYSVFIPGAAHLQGSNLIVRVRDTTGLDQNPTIVVDSILGDVTVYFASPTTGTIFINGGLGQSLPNPSFGFLEQATITIPRSLHRFNTPNLDVAVFDVTGTLISSGPTASATVQVDPSSYAVTVSFSAIATGRIVVQGCMGTSSPVVPGPTVRYIAAADTATANDHTLICDTTSAAFTETLPLVPAPNQFLIVVATGANNLTLAGNGIPIGSLNTYSQVLVSPGTTMRLQYDSHSPVAAWRLV